MKDYQKAWDRITALARSAPQDSLDAPSPGFVTRVAARGIDARRRPEEFIVRYSIRAFGLAAALAVVCAVTNINLIVSDNVAEGFSQDPVGELITEL